MSMQKYQAFVCAVEKGSLSKAAEELGYTQSGISHMMKSLEEEVGFPLLVRTATGIRPNPEGEMLLPYIRELLGSNENLEQSISAIRGVDTGRIRIASFFSVAVSWLPWILREFRRDYPNVDVQIIEGGADEVESLVLGREVTVLERGQTRTALALDLNPDFSLQVREADGRERALASGEVRVKL
mgnify:CR=1 FL=1